MCLPAGMRRLGKFPGAERLIAEKAKRFLVKAKPPAKEEPTPPPPASDGKPLARRGRPLDGMRRLAARRRMALAGKRKPLPPPPPASDDQPLVGYNPRLGVGGRILRSDHVGKSFMYMMCQARLTRSCLYKPKWA